MMLQKIGVCEALVLYISFGGWEWKIDVQKPFDHVRHVLNKIYKHKLRRKLEQDHEAGKGGVRK
jgi:hypothetical protein